MRFLIIVFSLFFTISTYGQQDITPNVTNWMKTGNSRELSRHFIPSIDLTIGNADDVYSRAQAEMIISKFFSDNPPKDFVIRHEGKSKTEDLYRIGKLTTSNGIYRVTFFLKNEGNEFQIKQLRIEQSDVDF